MDAKTPTHRIQPRHSYAVRSLEYINTGSYSRQFGRNTGLRCRAHQPKVRGALDHKSRRLACNGVPASGPRGTTLSLTRAKRRRLLRKHDAFLTGKVMPNLECDTTLIRNSRYKTHCQKHTRNAQQRTFFSQTNATDRMPRLLGNAWRGPVSSALKCYPQELLTSAKLSNLDVQVSPFPTADEDCLLISSILHLRDSAVSSLALHTSTANSTTIGRFGI